MCIRDRHYTFTANAFVELVRKYSHEHYEFILNETQTHQIIEDVRNRFSDLGILFLSSENEGTCLLYTSIRCRGKLVFCSVYGRKHVFYVLKHSYRSV